MPFRRITFRAGEPLSASRLNELFTELERLSRLTVTPPLSLEDGPLGLQLALRTGEEIWIKLTGGGTGGKYDWIQQQGVSGGTWEDHSGGRTGSVAEDPAVETNGNPDLDTPVGTFLARRDLISGTLFFMAGTCS